MLPNQGLGATQRSQNTLGTSQGANLHDGEQTFDESYIKASDSSFPAMVRFIVEKMVVNIKKSMTSSVSLAMKSLRMQKKNLYLKNTFVWWSQKVFDLKDAYHQSQFVMINYPRLFWFHHPACFFKGVLKNTSRIPVFGYSTFYRYQLPSLKLT